MISPHEPFILQTVRKIIGQALPLVRAIGYQIKYRLEMTQFTGYGKVEKLRVTCLHLYYV